MQDPGPGEWLLRAAGDDRDRPALITEGGALGYAELYRRLGHLTARVEAATRGSSGPFAVLTRRTERIARALYWALYSGRPLLPLDPDRRGISELMADCTIDQVFVDPELEPELPGGGERLPADWLDRADGDAIAPPRSSREQAVCLYTATSGTRSARPRAAMLTGANLAAAVEASRSRIPLGPGDRWLACLPLFHIGGLSILLRCLRAGACVVLHEGFDVARVWAALTDNEITQISLVPAMLSRLLDQSDDSPPPERLRVALVGGGPLSNSLARRAHRAGWPLCATYGLTEAASQVATHCGLSDFWQADDMGPALPGTRLEIVDEQGLPAPGVGRIRICGPTVMTGYANPAGAKGMGLHDGGFVSADLGFLDRQGHLRLLGRADDLLVSGGETIHPAEVEQRLMACPGVEDVGVSARADPIWGDLLVALVVGNISPDRIHAWARQHLGPRLRPRELVLVEALPRNALGKLDRRALARMVPV